MKSPDELTDEELAQLTDRRFAQAVAYGLRPERDWWRESGREMCENAASLLLAAGTSRRVIWHALALAFDAACGEYGE